MKKIINLFKEFLLYLLIVMITVYLILIFLAATIKTILQIWNGMTI